MNSIQLPLGMQLLGQQPSPLYSHMHLPHDVHCIVLIVSPVLTILCLQLCYEVDTKVTLLQKSKLRYREIKYTQEQVQSRNQIVINPSILSPVPPNLRFYCLFLPLMLKFQMPVCLVKNSLCPLFCILEDLRHSSVIACLSSGLNRLQFICLMQQTFWEEVIQGHQGDYQEAYLFSHFCSAILRYSILSSGLLPHSWTMAATLPGIFSTFLRRKGMNKGLRS